MNQIALEKTTNTHLLKSKGTIAKKFESNSEVILELSSKRAVVSHGEHKDIYVSSQYIGKYIQKEVNPITKKIEDAND